jgi:hypothetical protein
MGTSGHVEDPRMGPGERLIGRVGTDPDDEFAASREPHRHVAAQQKGEAPEHHPLLDAVLAGQLCPEALGELLVDGHLGRTVHRPRPTPRCDLATFSRVSRSAFTRTRVAPF